MVQLQGAPVAPLDPTLMIHSRDVYNFIGITLVAAMFFYYSIIMNSCQEIVSDFGHFLHLCTNKSSRDTAFDLTKPIHSQSRTPFMRIALKGKISMDNEDSFCLTTV